MFDFRNTGKQPVFALKMNEKKNKRKCKYYMKETYLTSLKAIGKLVVALPVM